MSRSAELLSQEDAWAKRKEEKQRQKQTKQKGEKKEPIEDAAEKPKKRKREALPDELAIDVSAPEPVSKKELRKAKKAKSNPAPALGDDGEAGSTTKKKAKTPANAEEKTAGQRSEFGVWIGNLPWSATKDSLRTFLTENTDITAAQITRVHMPPPSKPPNPNWTTKPLNKGFAYVDFSDQLSMYAAIALTETKMDGRPLLIKNAKSFEGRPEKPKNEEGTEDGKKGKAGNPPNKRVFVGNLSFDVTKEDLQHHFAQCGEVADIHVATFEDSGKCKGYAWVTFEAVESATAAVKGYIFKEAPKQEAEGSDEEGEGKKAKKTKWFVNRLMGRELRCEFAEDATTRYNKRYGKEKTVDMEGVHPDRARRFDEEEPSRHGRPNKQPREKKPRAKVDPRTIKSGAAHTSAPRAPQGIVEAQGTKITFD
jgi:RNA recognition motif-containing protein